MRYMIILFAMVLTCKTLLAMPKVGDSESGAMEISENGKVTLWSTYILEYLSYDAATDVFTVRSTGKDSSGKMSVRTVTRTGNELRNIDNQQLHSMRYYCGPGGHPTEILTLKGGQTVEACKDEHVLSDGRRNVYYSAIVPGRRFVRETSSQTYPDGLLVESVQEVTGFISN